MSDAASQIEEIVLGVHRRNGGARMRLDFGLRLLDPSLSLDSLDLAEISVSIERRFHCAPFDATVPPRTWVDLLRQVEGALAKRA